MNLDEITALLHSRGYREQETPANAVYLQFVKADVDDLLDTSVEIVCFVQYTGLYVKLAADYEGFRLITDILQPDTPEFIHQESRLIGALHTLQEYHHAT